MSERHIQAVVIEHIQRCIDAIAVGTYATAATAPPALTYDKLLETFRSIPKAPSPLRIVEVPLYAVRVQARRHPRKKRRLQKKWLTRYGYRTEYRRHFEPGQMFVDKSRSIVYAHREEVEALKRRMSEGRPGYL